MSTFTKLLVGGVVLGVVAAAVSSGSSASAATPPTPKKPKPGPDTPNTGGGGAVRYSVALDKQVTWTESQDDPATETLMGITLEFTGDDTAIPANNAQYQKLLAANPQLVKANPTIDETVLPYWPVPVGTVLRIPKDWNPYVPADFKRPYGRGVTFPPPPK